MGQTVQILSIFCNKKTKLPKLSKDTTKAGILQAGKPFILNHK